VTIDGIWIGNWIYWPLTDHNYNYKSLTGLHTLKITVTAAHIKSSVFSSRLLVTDLNAVLCLCHYCVAHIPQLNYALNFTPHLSPLGTDQQKTQFFYCCMCVCWGSHVIAAQPIHWHAGCCLAMAVVLLFVSQFLPSNGSIRHSIQAESCNNKI
jgi:hypothetical protein